MNSSSEIPLDYPEPKSTGNYVIPSLGLHDGVFLYSYISAFMSYITPYDLPVEILRDAFHAKVSILQLVLEVLKVESGFICLMVLFFIISLIPLAYVIAWGCSKSQPPPIETSSENGGIENNGIDNLVALEETLVKPLHCRRKCLVIILQILLVLLVLAIVMMFVTNEQTSSAIEQTPMLIRSSLKDVETFLKDIHHQVVYTVHEGFNTMVERIKIDLEGIDALLGDPIQTQLLTNTGLDFIFEALMDICTSSTNLSHRISSLHESLLRAIHIINEVESRLEEIEIQLSVLQRQCSYRDRPLCDTLRMRGIEESGAKEQLRKLQQDLTLNKLKSMADIDGSSTLRNLTDELSKTRSLFRKYSLKVSDHTVNASEKLEDQLQVERNEIHAQTRVFTATVRTVVDKIDHSWGYTEPLLKELSHAGFFLWIFGLSASGLALFGSLLFLASISCDCCHCENKARISLIVSSSIVSVSSVIFVIFIIFQLIVGGHSQFFICRPMYEAPKYSVLSRLLDNPGLIYEKELPNGIIGELFRSPDNAPINVSLSEAINHCQAGESAYDVFDIETLLNLTMDFRHHPLISAHMEDLNAPEEPFRGLTNAMQDILEEMVADSTLNTTSYRLQLVQLTPEKDLSTFIDQMQRIQDTATVTRMTTLGSRAKRIQTTLLSPLEQLRSDIVYHLTALELQIKPWVHQVNKSLNQLKTAQFYLDHEAANICMNASEVYKKRLKSHVEYYYKHTMTFISGDSTSCRPLFDIYDAIRQLFCRHIVDPINGLWFCSSLVLLLWMISTPIALALSTVFRQIHALKRHAIERSSSYRETNEGAMISEQSGWSTRSQVTADIDRETDSITLVRRGADRDDGIVQVIFEEIDDEEPQEALI